MRSDAIPGKPNHSMYSAIAQVGVGQPHSSQGAAEDEMIGYATTKASSPRLIATSALPRLLRQRLVFNPSMRGIASLSIKTRQIQRCQSWRYPRDAEPVIRTARWRGMVFAESLRGTEASCTSFRSFGGTVDGEGFL